MNDGGGGEGFDFALRAEPVGFGAEGDDDELEADESGGGGADDDVEGFPTGKCGFHFAGSIACRERMALRIKHEASKTRRAPRATCFDGAARGVTSIEILLRKILSRSHPKLRRAKSCSLCSLCSSR